MCRTSEDESQQVYSFDKGYRCFSGKAPFIESEKIFREILSALEKEKMQAAHIDRVLDLNPEKVNWYLGKRKLHHTKGLASIQWKRRNGTLLKTRMKQSF